MKTFLVIAAALACASAKPKFGSSQQLGSWSDNGQDWGSWSDNGQDWESWLGNSQDWSSWLGNGQDWSSWLGNGSGLNRRPSLSNLCQLLQLINNSVEWPVCSAVSETSEANRAEQQDKELAVKSLSQLCQLLQSINNNVNWPVCQIASAAGK